MEVVPANCKNHPQCPHGPCLIFERICTNGKKSGRKFFACSACRDRSICHFFHWVDDELSANKKAFWKEIIEKNKPPLTHLEYLRRLSVFQKLPPSTKAYCKECSLLIRPKEKSHQNHEKILNVTSQNLFQPTTLFQNLQNNKAEAQYFFSKKTVHFVVELLNKLGFSKLLLIGTPKVHEYIITNKEKYPALSSLLMDIDHRYMQFFKPEQFIHYNLFNNHFFGGKACKKTAKQFLREEEGEKVAVLLDPPFGGLIDAISYSLQKINEWWRTINHKPVSETVPILWFFPYFFEPRIIKNCPDLVMMDYKVEYLNHKKFGKNANSKGSPVRIFSNIPSASFVLPKNKGYRFCEKCQRFVFKENSHCLQCNSCTTKHGNTYKHCEECQRCVKSTFVHCNRHGMCSRELSENKCGCSTNQEDGYKYEKCFKCFGYGHRKRECPTNKERNRKKQKRN